MTQEQIDKAYESFRKWEEELFNHNFKIIQELDCGDDFQDLIGFCTITNKMEWVQEPKIKPEYNPDVYGKLTLTHVDQWSVGIEGDSFEGFMYVKVQGKNKWLKIPYSC